jgi:hypothetical protein
LAAINPALAKQRFSLSAEVDTDSPDPVLKELRGLLGEEAVERGAKPGEFIIRKEMEGESAKDLNRTLLSALRREEKRTRLRAEWTAQDGTVYKFFDYVLKRVVEP